MAICSNCQTEIRSGQVMCPNCRTQLRPSSVIQPPPRRSPTVAASTPDPEKVTPAGAVLAGGLLIAGSIMPWATITSPFGTLSMAGLESWHGMLTLAAGIAAVLAGVSAWNAERAVTQGVALLCAGALAGWISVTDGADVAELARTVADDVVRAHIGAGLYLIVPASLLSVAAGLALLSRR